MWRFALEDLERKDAKRPDVRVGIVARAGDHLRRHPMWCANHSVLHGHRPVGVCAHSKIGQLDDTTGGEEDIAGLDVTMEDVHLIVEVRQAH